MTSRIGRDPSRRVHPEGAAQPIGRVRRTERGEGADRPHLEPGGRRALDLRRLEGPAPATHLPEIGRTRRADGSIQLGPIGAGGRRLSLSPTGRFLLEGRIAGAPRGSARAGLAVYLAAEAASLRGGIFDAIPMTPGLRRNVLRQLEETLEGALVGRRTTLKDKALSGAISLLIGLADDTPAREVKTKREAIDAALRGLSGSKNLELVGFYLRVLEQTGEALTGPQRAELRKISARVLPERPLVEEYTAGRTKPLEVRHHVHPEFWKEELRYFSKKNGWELIKQNAKDTLREYRAELEDPTGKRGKLQVHMTVEKGELDYLDDVSDPAAHVILYSGHSAVGGNGSQAIQAAGAMKGPHPKLIFAANCRGKDNYAELTNKWPEAHVIMTEHPTYSDSGQARIEALFAGLARGETYAWMRGQNDERFWDEPKSNYFFPDERRKFRHMDADDDGRADGVKLSADALFDVDRDRSGAKFIRALNFANSELFYHWEVDAENGLESRFGRKYGDSLVAAGPIPDPRPGELVRVEPTVVDGPRGGEATRFVVRYNAELARRMDQNLLAGHVTAHVVMALAKHDDPHGVVSKKEALRAALMGAQAIHYLDVYEDTSPVTFERYFRELGFAKEVPYLEIERLFERFDAHANDPHVEAFSQLLAGKCGVDVAGWQPKLRGKDVLI